MEHIWNCIVGQQSIVKRFALIIICTAIIWLAGSFSTTLIAAQSISKPVMVGTTQLAVDYHQASTDQPIVSSVPFPTPISTPIGSFPPTVAQEQALLAAQGRFFYSGNRALPEIALTFDDGPNPPYTSQVLAILRQYQIHATFFCIGRQVQAFPDLVRLEAAEGNLVENHTWAHPYLPALSPASIAWQMTTTSDAIERVTGTRPAYFRPPYGSFNAQVLTYVNQMGLSAFIWDADPRDWSRPGTNAIVASLHSQIRNGSIILLHDGGGDRSQTVAALPAIIAWYQQRGFRFVTLQQLAADAQVKTVAQGNNAPLATSALAARGPSISLPPLADIWRREACSGNV